MFTEHERSKLEKSIFSCFDRLIESKSLDLGLNASLWTPFSKIREELKSKDTGIFDDVIAFTEDFGEEGERLSNHLLGILKKLIRSKFKIDNNSNSSDAVLSVIRIVDFFVDRCEPFRNIFFSDVKFLVQLIKCQKKLLENHSVYNLKSNVQFEIAAEFFVFWNDFFLRREAKKDTTSNNKSLELAARYLKIKFCLRERDSKVDRATSTEIKALIQNFRTKVFDEIEAHTQTIYSNFNFEKVLNETTETGIIDSEESGIEWEVDEESTVLLEASEDVKNMEKNPFEKLFQANRVNENVISSLNFLSVQCLPKLNRFLSLYKTFVHEIKNSAELEQSTTIVGMREKVFYLKQSILKILNEFDFSQENCNKSSPDLNVLNRKINHTYGRNTGRSKRKLQTMLSRIKKKAKH